MVTTRKRATPGAEAPVSQTKKRQRRDQPSPTPTQPAAAPPHASPIRSPTKAASLPKGRRGKALLAAVGVTAPEPAPLASPPKPATCKSPPKAAPPTAVALAQRRPSSPRREPLLKLVLPKSYTALEDFFAALQLNYGMLRKRGQRCTYQSLRAAVEEHTGRRFLVSHLSQLHYLLPDVVSLEWVRLPVAPHSSRTEPHLAIAIGSMPEHWEHPSAAAQGQQGQGQPAAAGEGGTGPAARAGGRAGPAADGEVGMLRQLLHYRLAAHLLGAYRRHLAAVAERLRGEGNDAAAAEIEAQMRSIPGGASPSSSPSLTQPQQRQQQPVVCFAASFLDALPDVPELPLPRRPDGSAAPSAAASPAGAAVNSHLPATPATVPTTGRPPLPPASAAKRQAQQRRLSFSTAATALTLEPGLPGGADAPSPRVRKAGAASPLDQLIKTVDRRSDAAPAPRGLGSISEEPPATATAALPAGSQGPAVALGPQQGLEGEEELFDGRILSEEEARVWDSLPEVAKRLSMDGIMSLEAHMAVEATARRHEAGSSKAAQEARALRSALGMLPKTYMKLQRIFGQTGPNAMKLQQVVGRLRSTDETYSEGEVESQLRLLAEHAPECCTLRPYGSCGTPAVWWDRRADRAANGAVLRRLKGVAEARHSMGGAAPAGAAVEIAAVGIAAV